MSRHQRSSGEKGLSRRSSLLAAVVAAALVGAAWPSGANAQMPDCGSVDFQQACVIAFTFDFTDTGLCAFPVDVHVSVDNRYRPFFATDGNGDPVREITHYRFRATVSNPATGRSFNDESDFQQRAEFLPDGTVQLHDTGLQHNVRIDDSRTVVFHQAGNHGVLLDSNDDMLDESFHGTWPSDQAGLVCPILAQPL
jgi:hypothetical protein